MRKRLRRAWETAEHPFLARIGGLSLVLTLVTGGAAVIAGFAVGVLSLVTAFPTWILVVILVGAFLISWWLVAVIVASVRAARGLPDELREMGRRISSDYAEQIATAPDTLPYPGPQIGPQTRKQERSRVAWRKSDQRRRRHFKDVEASYARTYRERAIALYDRAVATGAVPEQQERFDFDRQVRHAWGNDVASVADLFETLAVRVEGIPLRKRLREHKP